MSPDAAFVPPCGRVAGIVRRMWAGEGVVAEHLSKPDTPPANRISFWSRHRDSGNDRLADALARQVAVAA